ncbi:MULTISPECIES: hypothetical protein [Helicobacter]|uniref:Uncharacterized protein n=1 Tax=Helicobacter bilis ATCC 43879 TaxID=613026 RepID=C3XGR0_9HELI|nr:MULTISPECIES: hypothetical protein [Helicobacter]EEO24199.1 hypothetical protein HRAG_01256 [Helicobacter bilis ATCC 43879]
MDKKDNIAKQMAKKGMRIRAWALSKGMGQKDIDLLNSLSCGRSKGTKGRCKELREMLELEGFYIPKVSA